MWNAVLLSGILILLDCAHLSEIEAIAENTVLEKTGSVRAKKSASAQEPPNPVKKAECSTSAWTYFKFYCLRTSSCISCLAGHQWFFLVFRVFPSLFKRWSWVRANLLRCWRNWPSARKPPVVGLKDSSPHTDT